jgi:hypothetical protein
MRLLSWHWRFPGSFADAFHLAKGFFNSVAPVGLGACGVAFFLYVALSGLSKARPQGLSPVTFKARGGFSFLSEEIGMLSWVTMTRGLVFPDSSKVSNIGHLCGIAAGVMLSLTLVPADRVGRAAAATSALRSNTADYSGDAHAGASEDWQRDACGVRISHDSIEWLVLIDTICEAVSAATFWRAQRPRKGRGHAAAEDEDKDEEVRWIQYISEMSSTKQVLESVERKRGE